LANKTKQIVRGFESGKVSHAFRNVYPVYDKNKRYLGTIDIAFSSEFLQEKFGNIYKLHTHFLVNKKVLDERVWKDNQFSDNYQESIENSNYLVSLLKEHDHKISRLPKETIEANKKSIQNRMSKNEMFSVTNINREKALVVSFVPIQSVKGDIYSAAYLVSYKENKLLIDIYNNFHYINIIAFIVISIIVLLIYNSVDQKEKLKISKTKAEDATKAKSEFLANMSHEIRTPLNAILGFIDLLKDETRGRKSYEYVNIIDSSSKSLLKIIEDILDFSKIESGKLDIDKVDFNTKAEFEVIIHLFEAKCVQKNISLTLNIDDNLPQVINTDPLRVKQVISNLLSNAIKFTPDGKRITVNIGFVSNILTISVKDEGIGISRDKILHIFEAFNQEDSSTTREYGGTGLGLSISSELVKLLGGQLQVQSNLGVGSKFYFSIPVTISKEIQINHKIDKNIDFQNIKLLLVEDNKANQMFMKVILKKLNITFEIANDGVEAVSIFKDLKPNHYDAILMDENMPNMNGIEATKQILKYEKENNLKHTPIIALTANALKGDRERFLAAGMDEYLTKPLDKNKLTNILIKMIETFNRN